MSFHDKLSVQSKQVQHANGILGNLLKSFKFMSLSGKNEIQI
jgi:hypothetical protein